jgi:hypothetical protein
LCVVATISIFLPDWLYQGGIVTWSGGASPEIRHEDMPARVCEHERRAPPRRTVLTSAAWAIRSIVNCSFSSLMEPH